MRRLLAWVLALAAAGCPDAGDLGPGLPLVTPFEVVATGGRSFAIIGALEDEAPGEGWSRVAPAGAWVERGIVEADPTRPFTVVSPDGACRGKVVAVLELAREIGARGGHTVETGEVWDAAEIVGCPSFEGDRRIGLDGDVRDAKWLPRQPGDGIPDDPADASERTIGVLHAGPWIHRIVERPDGSLHTVPSEREPGQ